jgi:hypothetical protein
MPWFQGNFHCHTSNSDGCATPIEVARCYKAMGMDFLGISDHNQLTAPAEFSSVLGKDFIAIPCSEYTGAESLHVLGVDVDSAAKPEALHADGDRRAILQEGVDIIRKLGGVPVLCHPAWRWAYDERTVLELKDVSHLEVLNAHPDCNSFPIAGLSFPEEIWDRTLGEGRLMFGAASDDAHWYGDSASRGMAPRRIPAVGTGWNVVKAAALDRRSIREAFEAGHFYATTGVILDSYLVEEDRIEIGVRQWQQERSCIEFIGEGGRVLDRTIGLHAAFALRGDEKYVRARVSDTTGCIALTQPVFPASLPSDCAWTRERP